jgi:uncharacterized protein (DUF1501 family)
MGFTRRKFLNLSACTGMAAATMPLWASMLSEEAFSQNISSSSYKAVVLITLTGGNDGNNMVVPISANAYNQYASLRGPIALPQGSPLPLNGTGGSALGPVGLHPSLTNVAQRFNRKQALIIANAGPMVSDATKQQLLSNVSLQPELLFSHPAGKAQWQSSTTMALPPTGWGGRIADIYAPSSGSLPPVLSASGSSLFSVGRTVQGVAVQVGGTGGTVAIPTGLQSAIRSLAQGDMSSDNLLISQVAHLRDAAMTQQVILNQAAAYGTPPNSGFSGSVFGSAMKTIAQIINGRSIVGASRQIFYCEQGNYDNHQQQIPGQAACLTDLDTNLGAFMDALDEIGISDEVLICTHSDFNRTMQSNATLGTDHAWGNHQLILGGGIVGGRIIGTFPDLDLGGSSDLGTQGLWIPTTSVTQMTAGIGSWMGLTTSQVAAVFPDLVNFQGGAIKLV